MDSRNCAEKVIAFISALLNYSNWKLWVEGKNNFIFACNGWRAWIIMSSNDVSMVGKGELSWNLNVKPYKNVKWDCKALNLNKAI